MLNRLVLPVGIIAALLIIASLVGAAFAEEGTYELVQTTDHYQITLELGPVTSIMLPDQVSGAQEGIVVVNTNSIPMELGDLMPTIDQGQAVNRLLEVSVHDKETGTLLTDLIPRVVIIDQATEWSRGLPSLTKMYHVQDGPSKSCFGTSI